MAPASRALRTDKQRLDPSTPLHKQVRALLQACVYLPQVISFNNNSKEKDGSLSFVYVYYKTLSVA
jgi:hypothetical protein